MKLYAIQEQECFEKPHILHSIKKMKLHLFVLPNSICALVLNKDYTEALEITHIEYTDYVILKIYCQMLISLH